MAVGMVMAVPNKFRVCVVLIFQTVNVSHWVMSYDGTLKYCQMPVCIRKPLFLI